MVLLELIEMDAFNHPYLYLFILSFILSAFISYNSYDQTDSDKKYNRYFIICNITLGIWAFLVVFKLLLIPTILHIYIHSLVLITATINVWSLMMFIYYYTNTSISQRIARWSWVPLVICLIATLTSFYLNFSSYEIYFATKDVAFYTIPLEQSIFMKILITTHFIYGFVGLSVLLYFSRRQKGENRSQYYWTIIAMIVIIGGGLVSALRIDPYPNIHIYPAFFTLFFLIIWKLIYTHNFFNILPIARTKILENLNQGIIVVNENNQIIDSNSSAKSIVKKDDIYLENIYDILPRINDTVNTLKEENCIEDLHIKDDEIVKHYNVEVQPIYDNASNYIGSILSFDDITELEKSKMLLENQKEELEQQKEELEQQNQKLENFASVLSHDIRNPLSVVKGYSGLIKTEPENEEHYKRLNNGVNRIENIIDDVLELTKQGEEVEDKTEIDLKSVAEESWGMLEFSDSKLHIEDSIKFSGDKSRIKNVFENLFRNSKDHTPANKQTEIMVGSLEDGFYIEDNGPGIPEDERDNVFDFGMTSSDDGTGLGLAIVKEIVNAHGWNIEVTDGEEFSGARFEILFEK